ncbi:hypothetical protein, partial [Vibrio parahaemolyticus]|uniref:hypothetical protein n=1 Tax=Vibrio parahaemolyticus TaxID=670 RepID=UPI0035C10DE1
HYLKVILAVAAVSKQVRGRSLELSVLKTLMVLMDRFLLPDRSVQLVPILPVGEERAFQASRLENIIFIQCNVSRTPPYFLSKSPRY